MCDWQTELKCNVCDHILELYQSNETIVCSNCKREYSLITNEISYAVAESYSRDYYYFKDSNTIYHRFFNNPPLDTLEEAYQDTIALNRNENNPPLLLNVIKKYHDALKMAVRRLIELNSGNLTEDQINKIQIDKQRNPERPLNIKNLNYFLNCAFPQKETEIDNCFSQNEEQIKKIWWVRNKMEHVLHTQWPINSKIFVDLSKNPNSPDSPQDILNYDFVRKTNEVVIDIYQLILDLRPAKTEQWQIDTVNLYKL